jgi:hypothetical protein
MSGIFKSIKKAFKGIGKLVKKLAPVLIIAAGVYFGGAYMMSMAGGASAAQSASVAGSFTKSAGVWQSFMGGLANGNAASSAAAYAEASYGAMQGGASVAAQAVAGTSAVQSLSAVHNVELAVKLGTNAGSVFDTAKVSGATTEGAMSGASESVAKGLGSQADKLSVPPLGTSDQRLADFSGGPGGGMMSGSSLATNTISGPGQFGPPGANYGGAAPNVMGGPGVRSDNFIPSMTPKANATLNAGKATDGILNVDDPHFASKLAMAQYKEGQTAAAFRHTEMMAMYGKQHERNMYGLMMQGAGVALQAYGASQDTYAEKKDKKRMNWKPTGSEPDVVDPTKFQYPELAKEYYADEDNAKYSGGLLTDVS